MGAIPKPDINAPPPPPIRLTPNALGSSPMPPPPPRRPLPTGPGPARAPAQGPPQERATWGTWDSGRGGGGGGLVLRRGGAGDRRWGGAGPGLRAPEAGPVMWGGPTGRRGDARGVRGSWGICYPPPSPDKPTPRPCANPPPRPPRPPPPPKATPTEMGTVGGITPQCLGLAPRMAGVVQPLIGRGAPTRRTWGALPCNAPSSGQESAFVCAIGPRGRVLSLFCGVVCGPNTRTTSTSGGARSSCFVFFGLWGRGLEWGRFWGRFVEEMCAPKCSACAAHWGLQRPQRSPGGWGS